MPGADKWTIARALDEIAQYIELSDPNPFRARAFQRAARALENAEPDIDELIASGGLYTTPGIGKAIGPIITELAQSGESRYLEDLRKQYPPGIFDLLRVPGLGLKKIGVVYEQAAVTSLDELEDAARTGRLAKLKGFGAKTQGKILEGIAIARRRESQFLLPTGLEIGESVRERLAGIDEVVDAEIVGSVRRRFEIIRNINLAIATGNVDAVGRALERLIDRFEWIDERTCRGFVRKEVAVWFHLARPQDFGATVLLTTGSSAFVEAFRKKIAKSAFELRDGALIHKGRRLNIKSEHDLFSRVDLPFVPPERREDGEDLRRRRPRPLVEASDLRGTFHIHTTFSDGRNSVAEMLHASRDRGFDYAGISDHSPAAYYAGGVTEERLHELWAEIAVQSRDVAPMRVFRGTEADILPDGAIDYRPGILDRFDFVVASIHSRFGMAQDEMTQRILKALDDPHVTFLGHLTGRLLLSRDGYSVDFNTIFDRAAERGVIIEINGNPHRLDVDWRHLRAAVDRGVLFSIHPDAHSIAELSHVISGAWVARKGGLSSKEIFNTRSVDEVEEWFEKRRAR